MPELPEVETVVRQLSQVLPGKVIDGIDVLSSKTLQGESLKCMGMRVERVGRKQKMVVVELSGELVMLIHLKMTGQLIYEDDPTSSFDKLRTSRGTAGQLIYQGIGNPTSPRLRGASRQQGVEKRIVGGHPTADWVGALPSKHTRVVIHFTDGSRLYFNDQRKFGWMKVVDSDQWLVVSGKMPPDVVDTTFTLSYLASVLKKSGRALKLVILDQAKIGGMGNIYANDALYLAGIDPRKIGNRVRAIEIKRLYEAMRRVIAKGIETGGASYSHFVDTKGLGGHYQEHLLVYDRAGDLCEKCGGVIKKISLGGRGTYFCPKCQR